MLNEKNFFQRIKKLFKRFCYSVKRMQLFLNGWANRLNVLPKALNGCKFFLNGWANRLNVLANALNGCKFF